MEKETFSMKENEKENQYDLAIIGAGPGGYQAAIRAAQYGAKVALIEKDKLGGTCLNRGCIPTKSLLSSSHLIKKINDAEKFGIKIKEYNIDFTKVVERKNNIVDELCKGIESLQKAWKNDIFIGHGKILDANSGAIFRILIEGKNTSTIFAKRVIIATGSSPALIPNFNVDHERILTSDDILDPNFKTIPDRLIIIGAGVIGCEFADIFANFGSKVTLLEMLPTPIANEEQLIIKELRKDFEKRGINIKTSQVVLSIDNTGFGVKVTTCNASISEDQIKENEKFTYEGDLCLISIGRKKESNNLGLERLGIKTERGAIQVNPFTLETAVKGIYAIGDVTGGLMLAHVASYEGEIAVANALSSLEQFDIKPMKASYRVVPSTIFTNPTIGSVGLTRKEAKRLGIDLVVGQFPYNSLGKAKCIGEEGLLMILADKYTLQIVGASCIGEGAPELIAEIALAMQNGLTIEDISSTIHSHPTMSEMVFEAAEAAMGRAIHKKGRPIYLKTKYIEIPAIISAFKEKKLLQLNT